MAINHLHSSSDVQQSHVGHNLLSLHERTTEQDDAGKPKEMRLTRTTQVKGHCKPVLMIVRDNAGKR
jgi:hypothetical protein